ncbi:MAG: hypothetical protein ACHQIG_05275 [Acidimicrobiia bacterium]
MSPDDAPDDDPTGEAATGPASSERRRSVGPLIALGLAVAVAVAAIVVALVGGESVSATAIRVNSTEVSQKTFNRQLGEIAPVLLDQGAPAGSVTNAFLPSGTAAQLAQAYVISEILRGHVHVTAAARKKLIAQNRKALAPYAPELRERLVDVTLLQNALTADRGQTGAAKYFQRLARHADVKVDPRYGYWNRALAQVCAPTGCSSAASGG